MDPHFVLFGQAHLVAVALAFAVPLVLALVVRLSGSAALTDTVRWLFAVELIATYALWYWLLYRRGWMAVGNILPMHLCDWAAIACIVSLIVPNQRTYELAYFWALSATLQATLTPELALGWPDWRFVVFFGFHCGVIAAVLYMTLGMKMRPYPASLPRVIGWTVVYGLAAGLVDWAFGVNFGFLRAKSKDPSVLDMLSPWPWYIAELVPIAIAFILILYAPFFVADRLRRRP
ncbi:MAG: TIGR02206 family membrane protein [Alphaproteobacteria bacterium]|nr:TIGR02206 family membrane protein [Alphaproteobacteria bacterium]MBV9694470.1 TIGR02206 family membrane protein [Alphaproteobacteria bacterium]